MATDEVTPRLTTSGDPGEVTTIAELMERQTVALETIAKALRRLALCEYHGAILTQGRGHG